MGPFSPAPHPRTRSFGKPLRVGEMNTISEGGQDGVSDVMAAALWTLDAALEIAATGACCSRG